MVHVIGTVWVKDPVTSEHTTGHGTTEKGLAAAVLRVISRNTSGDCLCLNSDGTSLINVAAQDVGVYEPLPETKPVAVSSLVDLLARRLPGQGFSRQAGGHDHDID